MTLPYEDQDRRIDDQLRRAFEPPAMVNVVQQVKQRAVPTHRVGLRRWWTAAAALLLTLLVVWTVSKSRPEVETHLAGSSLAALWVDAYKDAVARGIDAPGCCDPSSSLGARCRELFAASVEIRGTTDVQVCGAYCGRSSGGAVTMLARCGDEPVCVFVVPQNRANEIGLRHGTVVDGVTIHRREPGGLVVFELSRSESPRLLPDLYVP
jgi:hypothetical protein